MPKQVVFCEDPTSIILIEDEYKPGRQGLPSSGVRIRSPLFEETGAGVAGFALRRVVPGYTGYLMRVGRASDSQILNVNFTFDGKLNSNALDTFGNGTTIYLIHWWDQYEVNHFYEADPDVRPIVEKVDGHYVFKCGGGRRFRKSSFIGSQTKSTISILWKCPSSQGSGYSTTQSGLRLGASYQLAKWWTTSKGQTLLTGSGAFHPQVESNDGQWRIATAQFDGDDYTAYENGVVCLPTTAAAAPPYDRIEIDSNADMYVAEILVWGEENDTPDVSTIWENIYDYYSSFFPANVIRGMNVGDSISTSYFLDPDPPFARDMFRAAGIQHFESIVYGGWELQDIINAEDRINWYFDNLASEGPRNVVIFAGTNDMLTVDGDTAFARLQTVVDIFKARQANIFVVTSLPRFATQIETSPGVWETNPANVAHEAKRQVFNGHILNDESGDFIVVDVEQIAIGVNGNQDTLTNYVDGVHLNVAGHAILGDYISTAIQNFLAA